MPEGVKSKEITWKSHSYIKVCQYFPNSGIYEDSSAHRSGYLKERVMRGGMEMFKNLFDGFIWTKGDAGILGKESICNLSLSCIVLDHFTSTFTNFLVKYTSPAARCLVSSKVDVEWGAIFDNLRKPR